MNLLLRFVAWLREFWRRNKNAPVALQKTLFIAGMAAAIAFIGGRIHPESVYRELEDNIENLRGDMRGLAAAREKNESEIRRSRLAEEIGQKAAKILDGRIEELAAENMRLREEIIFYRRFVGAESHGELNIYALEETPDFRAGYRRFSAVLVYPQTEFSGSYYFEAAVAGENGAERVVRAPSEENAPLQFDSYAEIGQIVELPSDAQIAKLRLVVNNKDGREETQAVAGVEAEFREENAADENGGE
ncbi:MAG: hypothetical protein ACR2P5_05740 [Gammaproteobacteria bacterium]